ncbi:hypothetical protein [Clostridium tagluense]|nr:hypothetical protein [Clostridium tagluense]
MKVKKAIRGYIKEKTNSSIIDFVKNKSAIILSEKDKLLKLDFE